MSDEPLRVGIVGGGVMGRRHAEMLALNPRFVLIGIADPYSRDLADEQGVTAYRSHDSLLDAGLDGVIVANPNDAHVRTTLDAHARDVATLVEKPLTTSVAAMAPLIPLEGQGAPILVGHHRRHHPAVAAAAQLLRGGAIGDVVAVACMWLARKADSYFLPPWRRTPGAGVILINAVHDLDLLRTIVGEIATVRAQYSSRARGLPVPDTATVAFETTSGALGTYVCSDAAVSPWTWDQATLDDDAFPYIPGTSSCLIAGTTGSLSFPQLRLHRHLGERDWNHPLSSKFVPVDTGNSYARQLHHFADVIVGDASPLVSISDVARTMHLLDAVEESARTGTTVALGG
jgi:predicted dehydrogenase